MSNSIQLVAACTVMVTLVLVVAMRLLQVRVAEMRDKRIPPQSTANSLQMAARLQNIQAADNYRNLFEVPVLFYALCAVALATQYIPHWLVLGSWGFVALRCLHSFIQCTYNKVMHRFPVFLASLILIVVLWVAFFLNFNSSAV